MSGLGTLSWCRVHGVAMDLIKSWYILRLFLVPNPKGEEEYQSTQRKQASRGAVERAAHLGPSSNADVS